MLFWTFSEFNKVYGNKIVTLTLLIHLTLITIIALYLTVTDILFHWGKHKKKYMPTPRRVYWQWTITVVLVMREGRPIDQYPGLQIYIYISDSTMYKMRTIGIPIPALWLENIWKTTLQRIDNSQCRYIWLK